MNRGTKSSSRGHHSAALLTPPPVHPQGEEAAENRRKLEALFGNSIGAPSNQGPAVVGRPFGATQRRVARGRLSERAMLLNLTRESMREAIAKNDDAAFERGAEKFLASHELPDDADFLCKMLHHPSDKVLCNVLGHISGLLIQRRMAHLPIVEMAVADVGRRQHLSAAVRSCVDGLLAQIERSKLASAAATQKLL